MAHLSLALPLAILTLPVIVLFLLRVVASIADARTAERSKRVVAAIEASARRAATENPDAAAGTSATSVSSLTEEARRDQG